MGSQWARVLLVFWLLVGSILGVSIQTGQEAAASATLTEPEIDGFPQITTYLQVFDQHRQFVHGLTASSVTMLEGDLRTSVQEISEMHMGVEFVLAVSPGRSFAIRDAEGISRFDLLIQALRSWAEDHQDSRNDDLSLLITNGPVAQHISDPREWYESLAGYQADPRTAVPGLEVLSQAVETVLEPAPRPGMGRVILFITPPPEGDFTAGFQSILSRAGQQGVRIYVWIISSPELSTLPGVVQLEDLASQTGGETFIYSGLEIIPDLEVYLDELRDVYQVTYFSKLTNSGIFPLRAEVQVGELGTTESLTVTSPPQNMQVAIQPPNPMFVSPPSEIVRTSIPGETSGEFVVTPQEQPIDVLVDFPDGHPRSILTTTLYVDGIPVAMDTSATPETLTWDLSSYNTTNLHMVWVEVIDSLGLRGTSIQTPIQITFQQSPHRFLLVLTRHVPELSILVVVLAGTILLLVLVISGRVRPQLAGQNLSRIVRRDPSREVTRRRSDVVTQPVRSLEHGTEQAGKHLPNWINRLQWPHRRSSSEEFAYLIRLSEADQELDSPPIPIPSGVMTIGNDPSKALLVLDDPSVDTLHSKMERQGTTCRLSDAGSIAGTWVNYTPVSQEGIALEHGDLVHFGRVGFRFSLRKPSRMKKPVVTREVKKD
jgi:hypothetical protein